MATDVVMNWLSAAARKKWLVAVAAVALLAAFAVGSAGGPGLLFQAVFRASGTGAVDRTAMSRLRDRVSVKDFGATGNGLTDDSSFIAAACAASTGRLLWVPNATGYRISVNTVCDATTDLLFERGATFLVDSGRTFTANGRVMSFGANPNSGLGAFIYGNSVNVVINDFGLALGDTPSSNSDDFMHLSRPVNSSTGINLRNDNTGASAQTYLHLWGGPISGGSQGTALRMSASSAAGGSLVNYVCENDAFCSFIQQAAAPMDFYTANVLQLRLASVPNAVNQWQFSGGLVGSSISMIPIGSDTNISVTWQTKGTGSHFFRAGGNFQLEVFNTVGATNRVRVSGSNGGDPTITTSGGNLNVGVPLAMTATAFAGLGTPANGIMTYCNDCTIANPCAGAGTGALAKRLNGVWVCN